MNKNVVVLIIVAVSMSLVSGLLFYQLNVVQNENCELENELVEIENQRDNLEALLSNATNRVKITDFVVNGSVFSPTNVGVYWQSDFFVTVENFGINDVENLTVVFNVQFYLSYPDEVRNYSIVVGTVKAGETKTVHKLVDHDYSERFFVATLMMNTTILDNRTTTRN